MTRRDKEMARQCLSNAEMLNTVNFDLDKFADLIRADEREACAKLCVSHIGYPHRLHFAAAIRAMGNT
jgi:hypothetical protein